MVRALPPVDLWPGTPPGELPPPGPETWRVAPAQVPGDIRWLRGVSQPAIHPFLPPPERRSGAAVLVCPGGGYWELAWDLEGEEVAAWLAGIGIAGIVLKYRVPRPPGLATDCAPEGPLRDAQQGLLRIREHADAWGIDPGRVGVMGFSVGGHIASQSATRFAAPPAERPAFAVAAYSGYLVEHGTERLSESVRPPEDAPPFFLVHAADDTVAPCTNSVVMHQALRRAGIGSELHVYATGGHGFGVRPGANPCARWTDRCAAWLRALGIV